MTKMKKKTLFALIPFLCLILFHFSSCGVKNDETYSGFIDLGGFGGTTSATGMATYMDGAVYFRTLGAEHWYPSYLCRWDGETVETLREDFTGYSLAPLEGKLYYAIPFTNEIRCLTPDGTEELFAEYGVINEYGSCEWLTLWSDGERLYCLDCESVGVFAPDGTLEKEVAMPDNAFYTDHKAKMICGASGSKLIYYDRNDGVLAPWVFDISSGQSSPLASNTDVSYIIRGERDGKLLACKNESLVLLDGDGGETELDGRRSSRSLIAGNDTLLFEKRYSSLYLVTEDREERIAYTTPYYSVLLNDTLIFTALKVPWLERTDTVLQYFCEPSPEDDRFTYAADGDGNLYLLYSFCTSNQTS